MSLTLKEAANEVGLSKPAILKAIQKGRISAEKDRNGHWQIEPVELFRVYPKDNQVSKVNDNELTTGNTKVSSSLQVEVEVLREKSKLQTERIEELRDERDKWQEQANKLLLTYETDKKTALEQEIKTKGQGSDNKALLWLLPLLTALFVTLIGFSVYVFAS